MPCKNTSAVLIQCEVSGCEIADVMNMCHRQLLCTSNFCQGISTLITMPGTQDSSCSNQVLYLKVSTTPYQHKGNPCVTHVYGIIQSEKKGARTCCSLCRSMHSKHGLHHKVMHGATFPVYEFQKFLTHPFADLRFQWGYVGIGFAEIQTSKMMPNEMVVKWQL